MTHLADDTAPSGRRHQPLPARLAVGRLDRVRRGPHGDPGALHAFEGLVAIFRDEYFIVTTDDLTVSLDFTAWGWAHVVVGSFVVVAGLCVMGGQVWARAVGVLIASLSILLNIAFLAAYPFWSLTMIALAIVVIMALTVHGSDIKPGG